MTKIQWTDETWNPITGCQKYSPDCAHCYAERMTRRLQAMGLDKYNGGFDKVVCHEDALEEPLKWRKPCRCIVCSMSDLFNDAVPETFIDSVFDTIRLCPNTTFQILTKRSWRMRYYYENHKITPNAWTGVTVENFAEDRLQRIRYLKAVKAPVKFVSFEPLIQMYTKPFTLCEILKGIGWVIVGGETGPDKREMNFYVVEDIYDVCKELNIPFFFKKNKSELVGFNPDESRHHTIINTQEFPR